ncbi:MAG: DUF11 domain-containing protein [Planctomycetaceae bacterium]
MTIADPSITSGSLTWNGGFGVQAGATSTLVFEAVLPEIAGVYVNQSTGRVGTVQIDATLDTRDDVPATAVVNCLPIADRSILKTSAEDEVVAGQAVSYTLLVTNNGPNEVTDARVQDSFPSTLSNVTWIYEVAGGGPQIAGAGDIDVVLDLVAGGTATFTITALLAADAIGTLFNQATVWSATTYDPDPANNSDDEIDTILSRAVLTLSKEDDQATVVAGDGVEYTYTVRVGNSGPSLARGVVVADD